MMQQDQAVAQRCQRDVLEHVVLDGHEDGQPARCNGFVGRPGQRVGRAAGHPIDFAILEAGHQARTLDSVGRAVAQLALVIVAPSEDLTVIGAGDTVQ